MRKILISFLLIFLLGALNVYSQAKEHPARYWRALDKGTVQCLLCPRKCIIPEGSRGFCGVRINRGQTLVTIGYGNPVAVAVDPIEKKPFFHVLPGTGALSIAVAGCNLHCIFCQNWNISQKRPDETVNYNLSVSQVIELAKKYKTPSIVFTYTEPTIFYEYMLDIAKAAKKEGLYVGMHSCGYINPKPLKELLEYLDFVNIDLKSFRKEFYAELSRGAELAPVLEALKIIKQAQVHLEITALIIPTKNDSEQELKEMCAWINSNLGPEVPLHISRFYPQYKLKNIPPTPVKTLYKAYRIAKETGLLYVYIGNLPGIKEESLFCPKCGEVIIRRSGYSILENTLTNGRCPKCGEKIPGVWQ